MKPTSNDLFRMVSLRGPKEAFSVDPASDTEGTVPELLRSVEVDVANPGAVVRRLLADVPILSANDLEQLTLARVEGELRLKGVSTLSDIQAIRVTVESVAFSLAELAGTPLFESEYRRLIDSWLKLFLTDRAAETITRHEQLIRAAHLSLVARRDPASLREAGAVQHLLRARIVTPRTWHPAGRRQSQVREWMENRLKHLSAVSKSSTSQAIEEQRNEYQKLAEKVAIVESIRSRAHKTYFEWKQRTVAPKLNARPPATPPRSFFSRLFGLLADASAPTTHVRPPVKLDQSYFADLEASLTPREKIEVQTVLGGVRPNTLNGVLDVMDTGGLLSESNRVCATIRLWEDQTTSKLPTAAPAVATTLRPQVLDVGWGELVVARERLVGYEAREIAHIENVLPGEIKVREHERTKTIEQITEIESLRKTESERDLQSTDRFELQAESQTTIRQDYSVEAGVNTSGRYGLTHVETSLEVGFQQSKTEARSSSQTIAQEIVSRAVERTLESVRELRRLTITEQIRELNRHTLDNHSTGQGSAQPAVSGLYLWVEKLMEVELRHYGTRLLVEFHIPEPALSLLEQSTNAVQRPRKPAPFTLSPSNIEPTNYLCLATAYSAEDVTPPPDQFIKVGYTWASAPSEDVDAATAEDTVAALIEIPSGYLPVDAYALVSAHPAYAQHFDIFLAVGGHIVCDSAGADFDDGEFAFDPRVTWPKGVPISVRAYGHYDKTMVVQVTIRCGRTPVALDTWRLRTWEKLRHAHERLMQIYRSELEEQEIAAAFNGPALDRPEAENRRVEIEELRKWAIKAMRHTPFNFNSVEQVGDLQEVDPLNAGLEAKIARFFEEGFEWRQGSYFLYPYYWSRRATWKLRAGIEAVDARHSAFLRAGSARYIVPVTPGYEERVLFYLESAPDPDLELTRLDGPPSGEAPADTIFTDLWLELLLERKPDAARGSGTLNVTHGAAEVTVNADSNWIPSEEDIGRELFIAGEQYTVAEIAGLTIVIDEPYAGPTLAAARYATGSTPYGPPWVVRVPTSLVILNERRPDLVPLASS